MDIINYEITSDIEEEIWKEAIIIFDSSALLNIYKLSDKAKEDFIKNVIVNLKKRIWLPFYVFYEYNKNRYKPINETIELYNELNKICSKINENFQQIINHTKNNDNHPIIDNEILTDFEPKLKYFKEKIEGEVKRKIEQINEIFKKDDLIESIKSNLEIGKKLSFKEIQRIINEGEIRYRHKIPPGYKDSEKNGFQKFADLIIWNEILKYSSTKNKSVIFVIDDNKEDWWVLDKKNKPYKPREELVYEICENSGINFLMYNTSSFIKASKSKLQLEFLEGTLDEIEFISLVDPENISYKGIKLSSNSGSGSNEQHRIERLTDVVDYIYSRINNSKIFELHDHKGDLTVYWTSNPTREETSTVEEAWESVYELRENVEHEIL